MSYAFNELHAGVSFEDYAAAEGLRASDLKLLRRSPAHWAVAQGKEFDKPALEFGRLFHRAMESPLKFLDLVVVEPVFVGKTKDGKDSERSAEARLMRAEWLSGLPRDRIVLKKNVAETLTGMLRACLSHKVLGNMFRNGMRETSLWVTDDETGEPLKCRPDFINTKGHIIDFKTTRDASRGFFLREIFSSNYSTDRFYALSAAHYAHCARISRVCRSDAFIFVAIEKEPPFGINIFPLDSGGLDVGDRARRALTKTYSQCRKSKEWPCYPEKVVPVEIPTWVQWYEEEDDG